MRRGAVILAAGASQRMGTPKALLAWERTTLLQSALDEARLAEVQDLVVVLGPATQHLQGSLGDTRIAVNLQPDSGRSTSIRLGCLSMPDPVTAVLVQSVDQPCRAAILSQLFAALEADEAVSVAIPYYAGRRGHPVCFAGRLLPELRQVSEREQGLREVVSRHARSLVEVPVHSASVLWNLNDPETYAAARAADSYS